MTSDFAGLGPRPASALVLEPRAGAQSAQAASPRSIARPQQVATARRASLAPAVAAAARRPTSPPAGSRSSPLDAEGDADELVDTATDLREELAPGEAAGDGVTPYLVGQPATWAGLQELSKEDLEKAERDRLSDRRPDPDRRLRLARRRRRCRSRSASSP